MVVARSHHIWRVRRNLTGSMILNCTLLILRLPCRTLNSSVRMCAKMIRSISVCGTKRLFEKMFSWAKWTSSNLTSSITRKAGFNCRLASIVMIVFMEMFNWCSVYIISCFASCNLCRNNRWDLLRSLMNSLLMNPIKHWSSSGQGIIDLPPFYHWWHSLLAFHQSFAEWSWF